MLTSILRNVLFALLFVAILFGFDKLCCVASQKIGFLPCVYYVKARNKFLSLFITHHSEEALSIKDIRKNKLAGVRKITVLN